MTGTIGAYLEGENVICLDCAPGRHLIGPNARMLLLSDLQNPRRFQDVSCAVCGAFVGPTPPRMSDKQALDLIRNLLDGREWDGGTALDIAEWVRATGRPVRDTAEVAND